MLEGEIIKFYRQKSGLTQEQLGKGICTLSYVSKIELGQTACSKEIITLLSERLHIDIDKEVSQLKNLKSQLHQWQKVIIMQKMKEVEEINKELRKIPFIGFSQYATLYQLLHARYYLLKRDFEKAYSILNDAERNFPNLPPYEKNMLMHVRGIYYIARCITLETEDHLMAVKVMKEIDIEVYGNPEYYYDLAVAYHCIDSKAMAYVYAEKSLRFFKETNNALKVINAESLMLLQVGNDKYFDFEELRKSYLNLIHYSELLNALDQKGMLLNNLGCVYYKRKEYANAQMLYKEALQITEKSSSTYLHRLYNYLESSVEGKLIQKTKLLRNTQEGLFLAKKLNNRSFQILFKLLIYLIENKTEQYYSFIENEALPYLQSNNQKNLINKYAKQLYNRYIETEEYMKVAKISTILIGELYEAT